MADVSVNVRAYSKLLLHAAKYPHCAVNGLLLAEKPKDNKLRFVDCIPLFHITLGLAPMLEIALTQIDTYCKSKNLIIGGYYQANVNVDNNRPDHIASVVGRKIHDNCGDALLFMVDNSRLTVECEQEVYRIHQLKDTNWVELNKKHTIDEDCRDVSSELLKGREYRKLIDFDNHLDDMNQDWRNVEINQLLSQYGALSMPHPSLAKLHPHHALVGIDRSLNTLTINLQKTIQTEQLIASFHRIKPPLPVYGLVAAIGTQVGYIDGYAVRKAHEVKITDL